MARELKFTQDKETKNTIRFAEEPVEGQPPIVGSLYIQRWALPKKMPGTLTVTIAELGG